MGKIAKTIYAFMKRANSGVGNSPDQVGQAKMDDASLEGDTTAEDWKSRIGQQTNRLSQHITPSAVAGEQKAQELLSKLKRIAFDTGYGLRRQQFEQTGISPLVERNAPGIPGRDIEINLPAKTGSFIEPILLSKEALLGALTDPLWAALQDKYVNAKSKIDRKTRHAMRTTDDPMTVPGFGLKAGVGVPDSFVGGFKQLEHDVKGQQASQTQSELADAKREFEEALNAESTHQATASDTPGQVIDRIVTELAEKRADGEAARLLNMYMAPAGALGFGAHHAVKGMVESRDPNRQKMKLTRRAIRQRMYDQGVPVLVDPSDYSSSRAIAEPGPTPTDSEMVAANAEA